MSQSTPNLSVYSTILAIVIGNIYSLHIGSSLAGARGSYMGKNVRVLLPSCAVRAIRNRFPSPQYALIQIYISNLTIMIIILSCAQIIMY